MARTVLSYTILGYGMAYFHWQIGPAYTRAHFGRGGSLCIECVHAFARLQSSALM